MRVLVITRAPWRNDNNTGNTMTNFFGNMKDVEFFNLYFREQLPNNDVANRSFAISETQIIKNLTKGTPVGREVAGQDAPANEKEEEIYNAAKKKGSTLLMLARELIWSVGRWRSESLKSFLKEIKPDIIFMPAFNCFYPYKVLKFVKKQTGAKSVLFHADDNYTLRQVSFSPIYWLYRFRLRHWVRGAAKASNINYAISYVQKTDYEAAFKKQVKVLTKGFDFTGNPDCKKNYDKPLQLVFTGNISANRWCSLSKIADALEEINEGDIKAQLRIYTATALTPKMEKALNRGESSFIMGQVPSSEVAAIQKDADILVHVEAFDLKNKLLVRQSFSTKIVDYFMASRAVLAVGPKEVASIDHLVRNECAIVAANQCEIKQRLIEVIENPERLTEYAKAGYECGKKHHDLTLMQQMLESDFNSLLN